MLLNKQQYYVYIRLNLRLIEKGGVYDIVQLRIYN